MQCEIRSWQKLLRGQRRFQLPAVRLDRKRRTVEVNALAEEVLGRHRGLLPKIRAIEVDSTTTLQQILTDHQVEFALFPETPSVDVYLLSQAELLASVRSQVHHLSRLTTAGQLVTTVVHEINNALSGIIGYSQLLQERLAGTDACRDINRVHEESLRASRISRNLLQFSRQSTGEKTRNQLAGTGSAVC